MFVEWQQVRVAVRVVEVKVVVTGEGVSMSPSTLYIRGRYREC